MRIINQGNHFCSVDQCGEGTIRCKTVFLSTHFEAMTYMVAETKAYQIQEAGWEVMRTEDSSLLGAGRLPQLNGCEAYFNAGPKIHGLEAPGITAEIKELLLECIRGIIQAECYLFPERGYRDRKEYMDSWNENNAGTCLHFSHLEQHTRTWFDYIGDHIRSQNLFNRNKSYRIWDEGKGSSAFQITGTFCDSFHEMNASLCISKDTGNIEACQLSLMRAPGPFCFELASYGERLVDENIRQLTKKKIAGILGGGLGCFHFVDLIAGMASAFLGCLRTGQD